ncbi:MAG: YegP family protein [Pseudorhodoplanes sp.]
MPYTFEIYKDKKEEFRVRFIASNGEKMFGSEGYSSKVAAKNAIKSILKNGPAAMVVDNTKAVKAAKAAKKKKRA